MGGIYYAKCYYDSCAALAFMRYVNLFLYHAEIAEKHKEQYS